MAPASGRFGGRLGGAGGQQRGGGAGAIGGGLLEPLLRAEIGVGELLRTVEFERGAGRVGVRALPLRFGRSELRGGLRDRRALRVDLPADAGDGRVLGGDLGLGGVDRQLIVAVVDPRQQVALMDRLIGPDIDLDDMGGDLGGDDRRARADIGVVGRDEEAADGQPVVAQIGAIAERGERDGAQKQAARRAAAAGPLGAGASLLGGAASRTAGAKSVGSRTGTAAGERASEMAGA